MGCADNFRDAVATPGRWLQAVDTRELIARDNEYIRSCADCK